MSEWIRVKSRPMDAEERKDPKNCDDCQLCYDYLECMADFKYLRLSHIIWHEYPAEKPNLYEQVIIAGYENWRDGKGSIPFVDVATYDPNSDWNAYDIDGFSTYNDWNEGQKLYVTAWAYLPEHPQIRRTDDGQTDH